MGEETECPDEVGKMILTRSFLLGQGESLVRRGGQQEYPRCPVVEEVMS